MAQRKKNKYYTFHSVSLVRLQSVSISPLVIVCYSTFWLGKGMEEWTISFYSVRLWSEHC